MTPRGQAGGQRVRRAEHRQCHSSRQRRSALTVCLLPSRLRVTRRQKKPTACLFLAGVATTARARIKFYSTVSRSTHGGRWLVRATLTSDQSAACHCSARRLQPHNTKRRLPAAANARHRRGPLNSDPALRPPPGPRGRALVADRGA